jgi:hypothetical protein
MQYGTPIKELLSGDSSTYWNVGGALSEADTKEHESLSASLFLPFS